KKIELLRRLPSFASCHWSLKLEREERKVLLDFVRSNASLAKSFDDKLTLSFLIPDPLERYQLQRALLFSEAEKLGFDAAIKLLDRHKDLPEVVLSPSISYFVDQLPRSKEEHSQAMAFLQERLKEKGGDSAAIGGMAVLDHILFEKLSDTGGLLKAALASATDEETFKNYFFNLWMSRFHPDILKYSPFSNQSAVRNWIQDLDEAIDPDFEVDISKPSLAFIIDLLYSLDSFGREILLRRCLVGKEGLLMQKEGSRKMIDDFLENRVDSTNQDRLSDTIKRALYALVETAELKQIYLLLAPILKDNFLVPPEEHFSFHELAKKKAIEFVDSQMDNYRARIINGDVDWNSLALYLEKLIDKKSPLLDELKKMEPVDQWLAVAREKTIDEVSQKLVNLIFGRVVDVSIFAPYSAVARRDIPKSAGFKWDEVEQMRQGRRAHQAQVEEQLKKEAASVSYFELFGVKKESRSFSAKLDPIEVVSEGGRILLPVGVRILQCLRQYIDLPDDLAVAFEKLMDSVVGQTRPTLFSTFKREAGADQVNQDFFDEVKVIGERIGGGSLVTVHEVELGETDNKEVLKVSNPNAIYRAEEAVQILRKVVDHMAENDPENRMTYLAIQMLLDDVLEWIVRDVNDERFYGNDEKVFDRYNGYDNGGVYSVLIPKHRFLSGPYLQAEELIEGHNLTKVRIDGEDSKSDDCLMVSREEYKDIICLYSQMFLDMVLEGRALSNLTPGNVRVAPGKKLAILDRRLYLELNDQDLGFLKGLYHSFSKPDQLAAEIVDYVQSLTQNKSKKINGLRDGLEGILKDSDGNWESALFNSLVLIRKHRLKIPLRLTLLIMNLKVLSNLSKRAGFDNLLATLMHRPNQELFAKLLQ
ncbi:MAG: hypothetical protein HQ564_07250, partial [Candidatus Saganbacteria bacterium]|nr:hypothetical protein [Candidatus Saganbacteria bacterium]